MIRFASAFDRTLAAVLAAAIAVFLVFQPAAARAQTSPTARLTGVVLDPDASTTDRAGRFEMAVTPGTYSISGDIHEAVTIDPFNLTNLFVNCAFPGSSRFSRSRIHLAINNLIDSHAITAVSLATKGSTATSPDDVLTLMSGRSVSVAFTIGYTGARP